MAHPAKSALLSINPRRRPEHRLTCLSESVANPPPPSPYARLSRVSDFITWSLDLEGLFSVNVKFGKVWLNLARSWLSLII